MTVETKDLTEVKFYVTKKQINRFIETHKDKYTTLTEFKTIVDNGIAYLSEPKGFNEAQIKFFTRVSIRLAELT